MVPIVVLCGGLGTRIRAIDPTQPKSMLSVRNRPFLEYVIRKHYKDGFRHFIFCVGYMADKIVTYPWAALAPEAKIEFIYDISPTLGKTQCLDNLPHSKIWLINGDTYNPTNLFNISYDSPTILAYNNIDAGSQLLYKDSTFKLIKIVKSERFYDIGTIQGFKEFEEYLNDFSPSAA